MGKSRVERKFTLAAVILAAGRSTRMGQPKLLLPWGKTSILGHLVEQWRNLGACQIAVVCAAGDLVMQEELERLVFPARDRIDNPCPECGMFSSIQCAARWPGWKQSLTHWALILGDQPHLRQETLKAVLKLAAAQPGKVIQPAHAGHRRHPVLLPKPVFSQLPHSKAANLKQFLLNYQVAVAECQDPGLDLDLDRPQDYERALRLVSESRRSANAASAGDNL